MAGNYRDKHREKTIRREVDEMIRTSQECSCHPELVSGSQEEIAQGLDSCKTLSVSLRDDIKPHLAPWGEAHEVCSTTLERCSKKRLLSSPKEVSALEKAAFIGQRGVLDEEPSKTTFTPQDYAREEGRITTSPQTLALTGFEVGGGGSTQNPCAARLSAA